MHAMTTLLDATFRFHQEALNLRVWRQQLLASNIANADTPGYRARDIDFSATLANAVAGRGETAALAHTSGRHLAPAAAAPAAAQVLYRSVVQPSIDGNTVDLDVERARFAENAVHLEANLTFISHQIKTLLAAIQG